MENTEEDMDFRTLIKSLGSRLDSMERNQEQRFRSMEKMQEEQSKLLDRVMEEEDEQDEAEVPQEDMSDEEVQIRRKYHENGQNIMDKLAAGDSTNNTVKTPTPQLTATQTIPATSQEEISDKTENNDPSEVQKIIQQDYNTKTENLREEIHPDLVPLIRSWFFTKQDPQALKALTKQPYAKNCGFLQSIMINDCVYFSLPEAARQKDKNFRQKNSLLLNSVRPLINALDKVFKIEAAVVPTAGKKIIATENGDIDISTVRQDMASGLQIAGALYYQLLMQRKALLKNYVSDQYKALCGPTTKFADGQLFGEDVQAQLQSLSRLSQLSTKIRRPRRAIRGGSSRPYFRRPSKNYQGPGWRQHDQPRYQTQRYQPRGHSRGQRSRGHKSRTHRGK